LLNPWVHTDAGAAHVRLKYYYLNRFRQPSFWKKLLTGQVSAIASTKEMIGAIRQVATKFMNMGLNKIDIDGNSVELGFIARMLHGFKSFEGKILIILSGQDATAQEFDHLMASNSDWVKASTSSKISLLQIPEANHTFSSILWRQQVAMKTVDWITINQVSD